MRRLTYSLAFASLFLPSIALAGQPGIPEAFHGRTTGAAGAIISVLVSGQVIASTTVDAGGAYGYAPDLFFVPDPSSNRAGATLSFLIGTTSALETTLFKGGAITALDLLLPGTTLAVSTTSATTDTGSDASSTTIVIATTTPGGPAGSSSGTQDSGGAPEVPATHPTAAGTGAGGQGSTPPSAMLPAAAKASNPAVHVPVGERASASARADEPGSMPVLPIATPPLLSAAALLAPGTDVEPFLIMLAYLAGLAFFAYALASRVYRLKRG